MTRPEALRRLHTKLQETVALLDGQTGLLLDAQNQALPYLPPKTAELILFEFAVWLAAELQLRPVVADVLLRA